MIAIRFFLFKLLALSILISKGSCLTECPFEECKCEKGADGLLDVQCFSKTNEQKSFPKRAEFDANIKIRSLTINGYQIDVLPEEAFLNLDIQILTLSNNKLVTIGTKSFKNVKSIKNLVINDVKLEKLEEKSLSYLAEHLESLDLGNSDLESSEIDGFVIELKVLTNLNSLKLENNQIHEFKADWSKLFPKLATLNLVKNDIKRLNEDSFVGLTSLKTLDLGYNSLSDLENVYKSLKPVQSTLNSLYLRGNSIENLVDFINLPKLEFLDLSENKIKQISGTCFKNLPNLNRINLDKNQISSIDESAFRNNKELAQISLAYNLLSVSPYIKDLPKLNRLDLTNQNEKLKLTDDSFMRSAESKSLHLILNSNSIESIDPKAFCSENQDSASLSVLEISSASLKAVDRCVFTHLKDLKLQIQSTEDEKADSEVCNCELRVYLKKFNIELTGACASTSNECDNVEFKDLCVDPSKYSCKSDTEETTTNKIEVTTALVHENTTIIQTITLDSNSTTTGPTTIKGFITNLIYKNIFSIAFGVFNFIRKIWTSFFA